MEIKEINDKQIWENFLLQCQQKTFLHSWNWGEFQNSLGNPPSPKASEERSKIWRWGIWEGNQLVAVALVIKHVAKRGSFLLVPHGPVTRFKIYDLRFKILKTLVDELKKLAIKEKVDFIRVSPIWERLPENEKLFKDLGFRLRALHTHPESSWKLNIQPSEKELLDSMRKTTRYLVKQAQNNSDIEIFQTRDIKDVEIFNQLHLEVVKKQKFIPFSLEYFKKEFLAFLPDDQIALFFAKYQGRLLPLHTVFFGLMWPFTTTQPFCQNIKKFLLHTFCNGKQSRKPKKGDATYMTSGDILILKKIQSTPTRGQPFLKWVLEGTRKNMLKPKTISFPQNIG